MDKETDTPQTRPGVAEPDDAPEKQRGLKIHAGIGVIGAVLSLAVAAIFLFSLDDLVLALVFVVVALVSLAVGFRAAQRKRAAEPS